MNSAYVVCTQVSQFALQVRCWASTFHNTLNQPPTLPLNPINPDNAWTFRITAAAGTELAGPYSNGTCKTLHVMSIIPKQKQFTTHRAVILHATWLVQTLVHWPIFLTAASRASPSYTDKSLIQIRCHQWISLGISPSFNGLSPSKGQVGYALLTRAPVDVQRVQALSAVSPRLACVKPIASVHPEPGSNSPL